MFFSRGIIRYMPFIGLQAGHENITSNCDLSLRTGTGAPGEADFTVRIRNRLGEILITKGFQVQLDNANANCQQTTIGKDFDFYLAIHYDANIYGTGGGFITAPDASVDASNTESRRIVSSIRNAYFVPYTTDTGIIEHSERNNVNATFYYMWNVLTARTPCGLIECGVGGDPHDSVILADTDRVCNAIAKGLCAAFNIPWQTTTTVTQTTTSTSTSSSSSTTTLLSEGYKDYLLKIKGVLNGKGPWWSRYFKDPRLDDIKKIVEQSGV